MEYRQLGKTDLKVSPVALGTWAIGGKNWGEVNDGDSIRAIHKMIDNGVNFIDCAPTYGMGHAEEVLGKALKGKREEIILLTKCGIRWPDEAHKDFSKGAIRDSSKKSLMKQVDDSLRRLQTDFIDVYLIHWPDVNTPLEETAEALKEMKAAGKIRYTGISNFTEPMLSQLYSLGVLDVVQFPYSMVNKTREADLKKYYDLGVGTMSYGSLGAGILTGAVRKLPNFEPGDARLGFYDFFEEPKFSKVMELLKVMDAISDNRNHVPLAQIALNWNIQKGIVTSSIMGVRNEAEADENCAALNWKLNEEEMKELDDSIDRIMAD